jgi:hypothetical protein
VSSREQYSQRIRTYLGYGLADAALRRFVAVEGGAGDEADKADAHGGGGDAEADVHPGPRLHPDEHGERHQLAHAEAEVGGVEVAGQPPGVAAAAPPELVGAVRDDVGLEAPAAQRHQVQRREEDARLHAAGLLARRRHHVARQRTQLRQVRLYRQQYEPLPYIHTYKKTQNYSESSIAVAIEPANIKQEKAE